MSLNINCITTAVTEPAGESLGGGTRLPWGRRVNSRKLFQAEIVPFVHLATNWLHFVLWLIVSGG